MGQTLSEYLYYDQEDLSNVNSEPGSNDIKNIFFEEDCIITTCGSQKKYNPNLDTIKEETTLNNFSTNENIDAYSKEYVKRIFLLAKENILKSENQNKNENFDLIYPIKLQTELELNTTTDFINLKEKYDSLVYDHEMLKNRFDTIKSSFDLLNKNYQLLKKNNMKYKFD